MCNKCKWLGYSMSIGGAEDLHTNKEKRRHFSALKSCTIRNCGLCDHFQCPFESFTKRLLF